MSQHLCFMYAKTAEAHHHEHGVDLIIRDGDGNSLTVMGMAPAVARAMADAYHDATRTPHIPKPLAAE